jgi:hypothetical protein
VRRVRSGLLGIPGLVSEKAIFRQLPRRMLAMRRTAAYVLGTAGALLVVGAFLFAFPATVSVNGHTADVFTVSTVAGVVLVVVGIALFPEEHESISDMAISCAELTVDRAIKFRKK